MILIIFRVIYMERQGLTVTAEQLHMIADKLVQVEELQKDQKCVIAIVNKEGLSDTWVIEE